MTNDFDNFVRDFNIVDNALSMRTLMRWNGRDLRTRENLAEHTHLVVACAIELYDDFCKQRPDFKFEVNFEQVIRCCMLHDSLELLRGDILSCTKDLIPGLRKFTDEEEYEFIDKFVDNRTTEEDMLVLLADLKACYKFIEYELRYPSNDFALKVYKDTKSKFDSTYELFCKRFNFPIEKHTICQPRLQRGYEEDAGVDITLTDDVVFMPMSTNCINLHVNIKPNEGEMGILCSRTSAANKGLIVAMCPIDANYTGEVMAIVHNISNSIITYKEGEAFCQVVMLPINKFDEQSDDYYVVTKKEGKRTDGRLGSTDDNDN